VVGSPRGDELEPAREIQRVEHVLLALHPELGAVAEVEVKRANAADKSSSARS
jgi:hypothetical protein